MEALYMKLVNRLNREDGQSLVEYTMLIGMVALGVFSLLSLMGTNLAGVFVEITTKLATIKLPGS